MSPGADIALLGGAGRCLFFFLWLDLHFFARGREPNFRRPLVVVGWLVLSLLAAVIVFLLEGSEDAVVYTTVYLIERSLSLDNLFVFLLLFAYFGVPYERRPRLLFWGIVAALALRGVFILGRHRADRAVPLRHLPARGGAARARLPDLARRGGERGSRQEPDGARLVRKVFPVTGEFHEGHWFVKQDGGRYATPLFLCLAAIVFADIAFAIDSIPAAFAITRDPLLIWMGNVFALLGLRALFVLVESLIARFRYLDETIAVVLGLVGVKLLIEDLVQGRPGGEPGGDRRGLHGRHPASSIRADRRDPDADRKREEREEQMKQGVEA